MEDVTKTDEVNASQTTTAENKEGLTPQSGGIKVEDLAKKIEEFEKRLADKDAHITELANEKATLEQRLSSVSQHAEVQSTDDMPQAVQGNFVRVDQIPVILKQQMFVEKVREDNKDLIELGLEPSIEFRARQMMNGGKDFETAISQAVKEHREKIEKLKAPAPSKPVPSGAVGEDGSAKPITSTPKQPDASIEDEGQARYERRMRMGL